MRFTTIIEHNTWPFKIKNYHYPKNILKMLTLFLVKYGSHATDLRNGNITWQIIKIKQNKNNSKIS